MAGLRGKNLTVWPLLQDEPFDVIVENLDGFVEIISSIIEGDRTSTQDLFAFESC